MKHEFADNLLLFFCRTDGPGYIRAVNWSNSQAMSDHHPQRWSCPAVSLTKRLKVRVSYQRAFSVLTWHPLNAQWGISRRHEFCITTAGFKAFKLFFFCILLKTWNLSFWNDFECETTHLCVKIAKILLEKTVKSLHCKYSLVVLTCMFETKWSEVKQRPNWSLKI